MKTLNTILAAVIVSGSAFAQDWPQWRGPNRDGKTADFKAPKTWPKELTQKWKVTVGDGVATPALLGDRLYVFSRENGNEVTRALNVSDGKELWQDKYESLGASGPAGSFSGPRSSPAVADGKVVTVGVRGMISCLDAVSGKMLWRKDDFKAWPMFHPSSSPMIVNGLAIAQLGGRDNGALVAYDLATGAEKWKWSGSSPAYASPALLSAGGTKLIVAQTEAKTVAINAADGKLAWESEPPQAGAGAGGRGMGGRDYKAATPIVDGDTIIIAGHGVKALKLEKRGDKFVAKELWHTADKSVQFNTPVLKDGKIFGLTPNNEMFCLNARNGKVNWNAPFPVSAPTPGGPPSTASVPDRFSSVFGQQRPADENRPRPEGVSGQDRPRGPGGPGGPGGRRGGGMGGGGGAGYGSIVDAGSVLLALTPAGQLLVLEPSEKELKPLVSYRVGTQTHAYPIASGHRLFIKDRDSVTLWTVQ
jgi:outer membrane protein assembly factor BamB